MQAGVFDLWMNCYDAKASRSCFRTLEAGLICPAFLCLRMFSSEPIEASDYASHVLFAVLSHISA